eukprot:scaffold52462_cov71-Phaeocystis_antarctica.AAC.3
MNAFSCWDMFQRGRLCRRADVELMGARSSAIMMLALLQRDRLQPATRRELYDVLLSPFLTPLSSGSFAAATQATGQRLLARLDRRSLDVELQRLVAGAVGVPERGSPLVRLFAQKLIEGLAVDVERLLDLRALDLHVLQRLGGQVHDRALVRNGSSGDSLQFLLDGIDYAIGGGPSSQLRDKTEGVHILIGFFLEGAHDDLGHHFLHDVAHVLEHARDTRNGVAAVDDVVRRGVEVGHQGRYLLGLVQAHDRLRRSERAGGPGDLALELGPGRASLLELAAHDEVRDVRHASPERVPGEEGALHLVLLDQVHDLTLVQAEGVLDQVDERAVRADVLGLIRPARGCQQKVGRKWLGRGDR